MMRAAKVLFLPISAVLLLAEAGAVVVAVRLALWLFALGRIRAALESLAAIARTRTSPRESIDEITHAVRAVSHRVPRATCLTQALAARFMLERRAVPAIVRIGAARALDDTIEIHAWVECDGRIVIGESEAGRYTTLEA